MMSLRQARVVNVPRPRHLSSRALTRSTLISYRLRRLTLNVSRALTAFLVWWTPNSLHQLRRLVINAMLLKSVLNCLLPLSLTNKSILHPWKTHAVVKGRAAWGHRVVRPYSAQWSTIAHTRSGG